MPNCPPTSQEKKAAVLNGEAAHRAEQKAKQKAEAIRLHRVMKEPHHVIMARLKITRPTLVAWLREAEMDGHSVKPPPEDTLRGGVCFKATLREREALASALSGGASRAGAFNAPQSLTTYSTPTKKGRELAQAE